MSTIPCPPYPSMYEVWLAVEVVQMAFQIMQVVA